MDLHDPITNNKRSPIPGVFYELIGLELQYKLKYKVYPDRRGTYPIIKNWELLKLVREKGMDGKLQ